jgi:hypothetical protein
MTRVWQAVAVVCVAVAAFECLIVGSILAGGLWRPVREGFHLPVARFGSTALSIVIVFTVTGTLAGLRAHRRLQEKSPAFARLAGFAALALMGSTSLLIALLVSPVVDFH